MSVSNAKSLCWIKQLYELGSDSIPLQPQFRMQLEKQSEWQKKWAMQRKAPQFVLCERILMGGSCFSGILLGVMRQRNKGCLRREAATNKAGTCFKAHQMDLLLHAPSRSWYLAKALSVLYDPSSIYGELQPCRGPQHLAECLSARHFP